MCFMYKIVTFKFVSLPEGDSKIMLGKVAMVPDPVRGGIMARTYLNTTLSKCNPSNSIKTSSHLETIDILARRFPPCF